MTEILQSQDQARALSSQGDRLFAAIERQASTTEPGESATPV